MIVAPAAAAMLSDFGAEVVKVEPPEGEENRRLHELPTLPQSPIPYSFLMDNRNKKSLVLDLKQPAGMDVLLRLIGAGDVFLTNYRPAALEKLGLTDARLRALNPRLVYANATGFGEVGAEANKPTYDTVSFWSRSGLEASLFPAEGVLGPIPPGAGDHPTAAALFGAVMLALFARERTGQGLKVSTSLLASGAWTNSSTIQARLCGAEVPAKRRRDDAPSFGGVYYRTRDGRLLKFALVNPARLWRPFCRAVGCPELADDLRFADPGPRRAHTRELIGLLDEIFATRDLAHWRAAFERHDVPFSAVASYDEVIADPQMAAIGLFPELDHPRWGRLRTVDSPLSVAGVEKVPPRAAPDLGQHTIEILTAVGYSDAEIRGLLETGVAVQARSA